VGTNKQYSIALENQLQRAIQGFMGNAIHLFIAISLQLAQI
jgi:hypothetical protein